MSKILFQGDSITDVGRPRANDNGKGEGYPLLVTAQLGFQNPGEYEFINRGISGNRSIDLLSRVKADFINLAPDYISILIGVNDVWHEIASHNGVSCKNFERNLSMLFDEIFEALPDVKIMMLEPFVLKASATEGNWDEFRSETVLRAQAVKRLCEKYNMRFIPLQDKFDEACKKAPEAYWASDGVHPTPYGHELIANAWIEAFNEIK
ncbi:MAG: SGNH/GDSL hydrolase family protein [Clostridia bacterium]|nr:SGNH/GDSL hydrolase family protein [Clostridia bacterium]